MGDNAGARAGQGMVRAKLIAGQKRIGHLISRGHVGGQGKRHTAGMTTRAVPELSPGQHQNRTNKSQGWVMLRGGVERTAGQARAEWEATQNDWCCRNSYRTGDWRRRRYDGGQDKTRSEDTAKGRRGWILSASARRKTGNNGVRRSGGRGKAG